MRAILIFAVVPLMAVVAWATPDSTHPVNYPAASALSFAQHAIVHGEVAPKPVIEAVFRFTNTSSQPVEITELQPSCGCLNPQLSGGYVDGESRRYAPGESGDFTIAVETANEPAGRQQYSVLVRSQSGTEEFHQVVRYAVTLPEKKLTLQPNALFFMQLQGEAASQSLSIFDPRPQRALITKLSCDHPLVHLEQDASGDAVTKVLVSVATGLEPGEAKTHIRIETNDPEYPVIRVPILLRGPKQTAQF